jgi:hypothetical protein
MQMVSSGGSRAGLSHPFQFKEVVRFDSRLAPNRDRPRTGELATLTGVDDKTSTPSGK